MSNEFKPFPIGYIFNPLTNLYWGKPKFDKVTINFPSRLNAMAIDPSKIAENNNMVFSPGEVVFSVDIPKIVSVKRLRNSEIRVSNRTQRPTLVKHAIALMRKALDINDGFEIDVDNQNELKHSGLGSSSGLIAAVGSAIHELYGAPIPNNLLLKYFAQNHGEEIENSSTHLIPVQCIGGSAASGLYTGSVIILSGESVVIANEAFEDYRVLIGVPQNYIPIDGQLLMEEETRSFPKFVATGKKYGPQVAYTLLHNALPAIKEKNLRPLGQLIFDYRFNMGSIDNCSFLYLPMVDIAKELRVLFEKEIVDVLSLSSVGPAFFAITDQSNLIEVRSAFERAGLSIFETTLRNDAYKVIEKI
jgi:predicted sugar kinase